jgi:hypothetical protein
MPETARSVWNGLIKPPPASGRLFHGVFGGEAVVGVDPFIRRGGIEVRGGERQTSAWRGALFKRMVALGYTLARYRGTLFAGLKSGCMLINSMRLQPKVVEVK